MALPIPTQSSHSHSTQLPLVPSELVFRFEPLVVAVECRGLSSAQSLVSLAISCGFRESGITNANKRVIVAIRRSIRMELLFGDTRKIMVSPEYVLYLVQVANDTMEANRKRTERFHEVLQHSNGFGAMMGDNSDHFSPMGSYNASVNGLGLDCDNFEVEDESHRGKENGDTHSGQVSI